MTTPTAPAPRPRAARAPSALLVRRASLVPFAVGGLLALGALGTAPAMAEKADSTRPIRYSANSLDGNEANQTVLLSGKVEVQQGTIVLRAERVTLKQQPDGTYNVTATGQPVTFRQKMDNSDEYVDAQALRVEYLGSKELVELYDQAWIKRGKDELKGNFLTYNSGSGAFAGRGTWPPAGTAATGDGRVTGVIQPRAKEPPKDGAKPETKTPDGAPLQPSTSLAAPPKE